MKKYKYLFGPVPSRRLGLSLGVDLTPYKTCSLDCIFCQLGRTTNKTLERREYVPIDDVLAELDDWFGKGGKADYITLSGSGEPTLHSRFGEIFEFVNKNSKISTALLTNGTMLNLPEVRDAACKAKTVKVSLSAWDQASFEHVNRPHPDLNFDQIVESYKDFRAEFKGKLLMEVFILWGINSIPGDVKKIAKLAKIIGPDVIQLNTAVRPPAEEFAVALPQEHMEELAQIFDPPAEVIAEFSADHTANIQANEDTILAMLQRRPVTAEEIAKIFGMHINEVSKYIGKLMRTDKIRSEHKHGNVYYISKSQEITSNADI